MKVGSKGYYGLLALIELAQVYRANRAIQVKEIARRHRMPEDYLGQIMIALRRSGLVHSIRGPGGGYALARPPEAVNVKEILMLLEGPVDARLKSRARPRAPSPAARRVIETWERALQALEKVLEETTLEELSRTEDRGYIYHI